MIATAIPSSPLLTEISRVVSKDGPMRIERIIHRCDFGLIEETRSTLFNRTAVHYFVKKESSHSWMGLFRTVDAALAFLKPATA